MSNDRRLTLQMNCIDDINSIVSEIEPDEARLTLERIRAHLEARIAQCWPNTDARPYEVAVPNGVRFVRISVQPADVSDLL